MKRLQEERDDDDSRDEANANSAQEAQPHRCCTLAEIRARPEIVLWYLGNCLSSLGFYMPFVNLVSMPKEPINSSFGRGWR